MKEFTVLGIETSCDETAAAIYHTRKGVLSNVLFTQVELQKKYGGVVPEVASRTHLEKITNIIEEALATAATTLDDVDVIAVTSKPGLSGALLIGLSFAKALAFAKQKKIIGINHLEGHAFSASIEHDVPFPHLCLTASGGHTSLYLMHNYGEYTVLGSTLDDAAGEAFDKIAKLLHLPYPGGPEIEKCAHMVHYEDFYKYPRSMAHSFDFSFSGLKTAVLYDMINRGFYDLKAKTLLPSLTELEINKIASSLLVCIEDIFIHKIEHCLKEYPQLKAVTFVGGVACNKYLKKELQTFCSSKNINFYTPSAQYCTDNAAMIAFVGHYRAQQNLFSDLSLDIF